jgi:hypothetical protein
MPKPYKARNKRIIQRSHNGSFRKTTLEDVGLGGVCPDCQHFLFQEYFGKDPQMPDPRELGYECYHCGYRENRRHEPIEKNPIPKSQQLKEIPKPVCSAFEQFFKKAIESLEKH